MYKKNIKNTVCGMKLFTVSVIQIAGGGLLIPRIRDWTGPNGIAIICTYTEISIRFFHDAELSEYMRVTPPLNVGYFMGVNNVMLTRYLLYCQKAHTTTSLKESERQ